jgi:transposase
MNEVTVKDITELLRQLRAGQSLRQAAASVGVSENTARRYRKWFEEQGWLKGDMPEPATLAAAQRVRHPIPKQEPGVLEAY